MATPTRRHAPVPARLSARHASGPRIVRRAPPRPFMAYPPRQHRDSATNDAAWIAWSIAILLWIGVMTGGLHS